MPIGVIINSLSLVVGGLVGMLISRYLPKRLIDNLPIIFGLSALLIALTLMIEVEDLTFVILCVIIGAIIGELINLGHHIERVIRKAADPKGQLSEYKVNIILTLIMLFCFSGTGIFGALNEGFTGDPSILLAKSVLDFFTAMIFGASIGKIVSLIAIPQFILNISLFYGATFIMPFMSASNIADFKAVGGLVALAAALKLLKLIDINIINLIPSLIIAVIACIII